jgi:hypothetical protein
LGTVRHRRALNSDCIAAKEERQNGADSRRYTDGPPHGRLAATITRLRPSGFHARAEVQRTSQQNAAPIAKVSFVTKVGHVGCGIGYYK